MSREGVRQIGTAYVVSVTPDVCLTPMGATAVPVPYPIIGTFDNAALLAMSVRMCGRPTFTTSSQVTRVQGDEAGTAGGVMSGVNRSTCESVTASTTVRAEGNFILRDGDVLKMNNGNTLGKVVFMPGVGTTILGKATSPEERMLDRMMHPRSNGFNFIKDALEELASIPVAIYEDQRRFVKEQKEWARNPSEWLNRRLHRGFWSDVPNPYHLIKPWVDAANSDDPDAFGAKLLVQGGLVMLTDAALDRALGATAAVEDVEAAKPGATIPDAAPPGATDPGTPIPDRQSPGATDPGTTISHAEAADTIEMDDPAPTGKWEPPPEPNGAGNGLTVTGLPMPGPIVLIDLSDPILENAMKVKPVPGIRDIVVHADKDGFWELRNNQWVEIPASEIAARVRRQGPPPPGGYRLIACEAGADVSGPAQRLSNELGEKMWASDKKVYAPDGNIRSGTTSASNSGRFRQFGPDGESPFIPTPVVPDE
jgi:Domain of unknown function (DUF4150)